VAIRQRALQKRHSVYKDLEMSDIGPLNSLRRMEVRSLISLKEMLPFTTPTVLTLRMLNHI
jgi:hypothetical protein